MYISCKALYLGFSLQYGNLFIYFLTWQFIKYSLSNIYLLFSNATSDASGFA